MKKYCLEPFNQKELLKNKIFDSPYGYLKKYLQEMGVSINTFDLVSLKDCERVLFFNHNPVLLDECVKQGISKEKRILFLWEPETVLPLQYTETVFNLYGKIFSFRDDLVAKYNFTKAFYPQGQNLNLTWKNANERKFLTMINAHKFSYYPGELYSLRREWIDFLEKNTNQFQFFGMGWTKNPFIRHPKNTWVLLNESLKYGLLLKFLSDFFKCFFPTYKNYGGPVTDKYQVLLEYNFCLCIENEETWFTEKFFDSLVCGNIPIYKGPKEITQFVPKECFINIDDFKNKDELLKFVLNLDSSEIEKRKLIIKDFLNSPMYLRLRPENLFKDLAQKLIYPNLPQKKA